MGRIGKVIKFLTNHDFKVYSFESIVGFLRMPPSWIFESLDPVLIDYSYNHRLSLRAWFRCQNFMVEIVIGVLVFVLGEQTSRIETRTGTRNLKTDDLTNWVNWKKSNDCLPNLTSHNVTYYSLFIVTVKYSSPF